jgi:hypothetical protein
MAGRRRKLRTGRTPYRAYCPSDTPNGPSNGNFGIDAVTDVYMNEIIEQPLISTKQVEAVILKDLAVIGHKVEIVFE